MPAVATATPALSWVVPLTHDGQRQAGYRVRVSVSGDPRESGDVWDSGDVDGDQNRFVPWGGRALTAHEQVLWSVRTRDETGEWSPWSEPHRILVGPLSFADWSARWIEFPATRTATTSVDRTSDAAVVSATLHLTAFGYARASVNGVVVNGDHLDPTDAAVARATYRSYDVSDVIAGDTIAVSVAAGLGHYRHMVTQPRVLAMVVIDYADGMRQIIGTEGSWTHVASEVVEDATFYLESHDASAVGHDVPAPVTVVSDTAAPAAPTRIDVNVGPPVRVTRMLTATQIGTPAPGVAVFDLGENVAGRVVLDIERATPGAWLETVQGEKIAPNGRVDTTNIRLPDDRDRERQVFRWRCSGAAERATPWFGVQGFRYVEVRGLDDRTELTVRARVLHSDAARTGELHTSDPHLDRLVDMAVRTQLNNTHGYPEDCPTREQGGWTGDASASVEAALSHLDLGGVYRNWLTDVVLDMSERGGVAGLTPILLEAQHHQPSDPVWGSALTEIPWHAWRQTGEIEPWLPLLDGMRRWADWQLDTVEGGVVRHAELSFGADWLAIEQTPPVMIQTAAVIVSLRRLADLEEAAGGADRAAERRRQADELVEAARGVLFDPATRQWANGSQASFATALVSGLVLDADIPDARARLLDALARRDGRVASGFAATVAVVRALADLDGGSRLLDAVLTPEQPGVGAMLVDGPGTFWETWWIDHENVGVASLDHIGLAAPFAAWAWRDVAGLRVIEPGYRAFAIEPRLTARVPSASFSRQTVRGDIECSWTFDGDTFRCNLVVPVGAQAEVVVPGDADTVLVDGVDAGSQVQRRDGRARVRLASGRHAVEARGVVPLSAAEPQEAAAAPIETTVVLSDGVTSRWHATDATRVRLVDETVVCEPVFHEPIPGPTLLVESDDLVVREDHFVVLEQEHPLDLSAARTAFAFLDLDNPAIVGRRFRLLLRLTGQDGSVVRGEARPLPIQWNRVAVDVSDWPGRSAVTDVAVGVRWTDEPDTAMGPYLPMPEGRHPFSYRMGRVGWTNVGKTY